MKRRMISLVLTVLLLCSMNLITAFADEVQEIIPYDSVLVADLDTTAWNNYLVQAQAEEVAGTYFIIVEE